MPLFLIGMLTGPCGQGLGNFSLLVPMTTLSIYTGSNTMLNINFLKMTVTMGIVKYVVLYCFVGRTMILDPFKELIQWSLKERLKL